MFFHCWDCWYFPIKVAGPENAFKRGFLLNVNTSVNVGKILNTMSKSWRFRLSHVIDNKGRGGGVRKDSEGVVHFYALGITAGTRAEQPGAVC